MRVFDTECETLMEDQIIGVKEDLGPIEKEQDLNVRLTQDKHYYRQTKKLKSKLKIYIQKT